MHKKKYLIALNIMAAIWIAAFVQIIINEYFKKDHIFIEAFTTGGNEIMESHLEITAPYPDTFLTEAEKDEMLRYLASGIGLSQGYTIESLKENSKRLTKNGSQAGTFISIITNQDDNKQYIHFRLNLLKNPNQITYYKDRMEERLKTIKVNEWQTTIGLQSAYQGRLALEEIDELAEQMLKALNAKTVSKRMEDDMYSVYAFTNSVEDCIMVSGQKINVQIAARYQESEDRTVFYYSTPIVNEEF